MKLYKVEIVSRTNFKIEMNCFSKGVVLLNELTKGSNDCFVSKKLPNQEK